jgi:hypothetical protein
MRKQRGITLSGTIMWLAILGFLAIMAAKLMPAYLEYASVKKIFKTMEQAGDTKGTVRDIRRTFDKLNAIENVTSVKSEDLEITKQGQDAVVSASWSVRVPLVYNVAACLDFSASTGQ